MNYKTIMLLVAYGSLALLSHVCEARQIILNEDALIGTCTNTCEEIHTMYDKHNCKKISSCTLSSSGWNRGFVRCDYCRCECEVADAEKDVLVEKKFLSITEPDLLGTCTTTCARLGLVRTNYRGCQEIRDCWQERTGWTRGFVRCDYCTCTCINRKYADKYRLENVKYDFSEADLKELASGKPTVVGETIVQNAGNTSQESTRVLSYTISESTSMEMSHSTEVGLSVTVEASGSIGIVNIGTSATRSISYGFTYTSGSTKVEQRGDEIRVKINVPPKSSIRAQVVGNELEIDIPYTATLVTVHTDGSETKKSVTGILTDVHTNRIRVHYEAAKPL